MRLIDADSLQKLFNATSSALLSDVELSKDIEHVVRACLMVSEMISDAPTIDAVERDKVKSQIERFRGYLDEDMILRIEHAIDSIGR